MYERLRIVTNYGFLEDMRVLINCYFHKHLQVCESCLMGATVPTRWYEIIKSLTCSMELVDKCNVE